MEIEEFGDLPPRLEDWTYSTVEYLVKKYEFEPGTFDYKQVLNPTGANQNEYVIPMCVLTDNVVPRSHASLAIQMCPLERTLV